MPVAVTAPRSTSRSDRACLALAFAIPVAWFFLFNASRPDYLVDEGGHLGNIYHFLEGKPGWPGQMTMLPGYHFIVAALWQFHPPCSLLTLARSVVTVTALLGTAAFALTWCRIHGRDDNPIGAGIGQATLLFAALPILQPFTALAYTDVPALAFVLGAFCLQDAGHRALAASFFVGAICLRQTNVIWIAFAIGWEFLRRDAEPSNFGRRIAWLVLLLVLAVGIALIAGRVTVGTQTGTELRPNIAILHLAALLVLLLGLPAWIANTASAGRDWYAWLRRFPIRTVAVTALAGIAVGVLTRTFANPHIWNRDLFWDGCTFTLLRNWPLVWIDTHPWLRVASAVNVILMTFAIVVTFARQPLRRALALAFVAGAALPVANNLVEPRYFIAGSVFILLLLRMDATTSRRLAWWWGALCAVHAPFIARGLSLW